MPLVLLVALLVLQGGYAPAVSSLAALALCAFGLFSLVDARRTGTKASLLVILPAAIPLLYLVSALFHGVSYSGLEAGGRWSLFAVGIILSATMASTRRQWLFQSVAWIGVVSSALGLVMADSAFQFLGWSNAGRLQFLFQYANTAGIWFSVVAVLSWFSESCLLRRLVYLPISCLLLTQSGGSLALSSIALVPMAVMGFRRWGGEGTYLARAAARLCHRDLLCLWGIFGPWGAICRRLRCCGLSPWPSTQRGLSQAIGGSCPSRSPHRSAACCVRSLPPYIPACLGEARTGVADDD